MPNKCSFEIGKGMENWVHSGFCEAIEVLLIQRSKYFVKLIGDTCNYKTGKLMMRLPEVVHRFSEFENYVER